MTTKLKYTVVGPMTKGNETAHVHIAGCRDLNNLRIYRGQHRTTVTADSPIEAAFAAVLDRELDYTEKDAKVFPCCGKAETDVLPPVLPDTGPFAAEVAAETVPAPEVVEAETAELDKWFSTPAPVKKGRKAATKKASPAPEKAAPAPAPVSEGVTFAISGKAMVGRSWDGGYQVDKADPYSVELGAALKAGRTRKMGRGWQKVVTVSLAVAKELAQDFRDNAEIYQGQAGDGVKVFALAFREAAEFIEIAIAEASKA